MTKEQAINILIDTYKNNNFSYRGSSYVLPNGVILDLGDSGYGHSNVSEWLEEKGLEIDFEPGTDSKLLRSLGWIRTNGRWNFINIPARKIGITENQYSKLYELFDSWKNSKYGIQIYTEEGNSVIYRNSSPLEIIRSIRRYYSFGTLREEIE